MQHVALRLGGSADASVQLTPHATYRNLTQVQGHGRGRVVDELRKLGSYGNYTALPVRDVCL